MNLSAIFTAAHATARTTATGTYRARFAAGLSAAYAAAKAPQVKEVDLRYRNSVQPATHKQFCYILSFDNVTTSRGLANYTQFSKKVNSWEASEIIEGLKAGKRLHLLY